ncbi:MAG: acetate--CoA ligase family protein [Nocardioides sp.]
MNDALAAALDARYVALVGASPRPGSLGQRMVGELMRSPGVERLHLVNPSYDEVSGLPCLPDLHALDEPPDLVLLGVGDARLVDQLTAAAKVGAKGAVVFGSAHGEGVRDELTRIATEAGLALVGAGCMGFWNVRRGVRAMGYTERADLPVGPVSLVTHSGSVFSTLLRTRLGLGFDLAVSSGQELVTTTADYVDHVVAHTETRVLALVLETLREGDRLRGALRKAREAGMEVVLLPVGRSPLGSSMVAAHSGAVAGGSAAWEALTDDVAGHLVADLAELGDTLAVLASTRRPRRGRAIATLHDSGAERSLVADLADGLGVRFAGLGPDTLARLADRLDDGSVPGNPLDVWNTGADTHRLFADCLAIVAADPAVGVTALAVDFLAEYDGDISYPEALLEVAANTDAPVVALPGLPAALDEAAAARLREAGIPVLEGHRTGLLALRHLLDAVERPGPDPVVPEPPVADSPDPAAYGIPLPASRLASDADATVSAAEEIGFPVVLKTAAAGITHRSDVDGVTVDLRDEAAVREAYADLATRLGPHVTVHQQVPPGVELSVGIVRDAALGPMVVVAAGGVLVELMSDRAVGLPPLSRDGARRMLDRLRVRPLLDGFRGAPAVDLEALVDLVVAVSLLAADHGDRLDALDLNPVIATADGAIAVDVLVVPRPEETP